ncbi:hypothetical protein [Klebsiella aerogenes]|uniref:hypothetical protein n=1 Tax=Klebsiella aerogenes TaxID=548 RepID=UPI001867CE7F|nr:hypothetical protein [Klebsiella aerogenes]
MLELNVSKINNVVTFTVDKSAIAEAKKAADDLHKYFQKIQDPKIRFRQQKQRRQKARPVSYTHLDVYKRQVLNNTIK